MNVRILSLEIEEESDVVLSRQRARQIAGLLGFPPLDQTRIATAASEIARNAFEYASGGVVEFLADQSVPPVLVIKVLERGPGIKDLKVILDGEYVSPTGMGIGITGARRLMDRFEIVTGATGGASVTMAKVLRKRTSPFSPQELSRVSGELAQRRPRSLLEELQQQNREFISTLQELNTRQAEITELHRRELEETNRGVVALYAELDENAKALKRISDLKSGFLSSMSHEFRSPLNIILSLTGFLLERNDGDLTAEQEKQITFIRKAAGGLLALVNDLLDLAKVEAGKAVVRPKSFRASDLFEALRGAIKPLVVRDEVALIFEEPGGVETLRTDEGKLAQILQNLLTNAVKFTERGEIRVSAVPGPGDTVIFSVADTGIGIAPADQGRIFEEFAQVEGQLQGKVKGTGLGLPLSRKLAELLGGSVSVKSTPGVGSTFLALVPRRLSPDEEAGGSPPGTPQPDSSRHTVLVVESDPVDLLLYEKMLGESRFRVLPARTLPEARRHLRGAKPVAVLLEPEIEAGGGWEFLDGLKSDPDTAAIPVFALTAGAGRGGGKVCVADEFRAKPIPQDWLIGRLDALGGLGVSAPETLLIVDDQEADRRRLTELLGALGSFRILEASDAGEGLRRAREERPGGIFLDLVMPDMNGFEALGRLKRDPATSEIPVIIHSSRDLGDEERSLLGGHAAAILDKASTRGAGASERVRQALARAGLHPAAAGPEG